MRLQETWEDGNRELEYDVIGEMIPYVPAQTCGPPERCYPAEGGYFEVHEIRLTGIFGQGVRHVDELSVDERRAIEHEIAEHLEEHLDELTERAAEMDYERAEAARELAAEMRREY